MQACRRASELAGGEIIKRQTVLARKKAPGMGICWLFNLRLGTSRNEGYALALALALSSDEKSAGCWKKATRGSGTRSTTVYSA